ncbi:Uncharacterised protein [Mycobacteroides abscessus subsp. abscessus]|nr:Uncharacterised protein [Mycobacteroides abscessus subsp. abscessus]
MPSKTTSPRTDPIATAPGRSAISIGSSRRSAMRSPEAVARAMRPVYFAMSRSGFIAILR